MTKIFVIIPSVMVMLYLQMKMKDKPFTKNDPGIVHEMNGLPK